MHIYVASSWRNTYYPEVVQALRDAGHEVFTFIPDKDIFENRGSDNRAPVAIEPELMYKLFSKVCISLNKLIESL